MTETEKTFKDTFRIELEPILTELEFTEYVLPKGWIQPSFLFKQKSNNIWFGCSFDRRDCCFEAELGGLFIFKDILPKVIVCGFSFEKDFDIGFTNEYITEQIINSKNYIIKLADNNFEEYYKNINHVQSPKLDRLKLFIKKEVLSEEELPFFN